MITEQVIRKLTPSTLVARAVLFLALVAGVSLVEAQVGYLRPAPKVVEPSGDQGQKASGSAENAHLARRAIDINSIHDAGNPDGRVLQVYSEATRHLPHDAVGFPDWMRALREGAIKPRTGLTGTESMDVLDLDIIMRNTREMPNVRFPHNSHTMWLTCSNCHPTPFIPMAGANPIRMADIFRGQFCGMCHDRVAFVTFFSCDRCHSVPQGASAQR